MRILMLHWRSGKVVNCSTFSANAENWEKDGLVMTLWGMLAGRLIAESGCERFTDVLLDDGKSWR